MLVCFALTATVGSCADCRSASWPASSRPRSSPHSAGQQNRPNAAFQALGGWYDTGDIVRINDDGYVFVLGRLKRFAKISGEMVSLTAVEEALAGAFPQHGPMCQTAVVSVPDAARGEKLILATNEPRLELGEVRAIIRAKGMSNLCAPREIRLVPSIPKLGSGKTDHRELIRLFQSA